MYSQNVIKAGKINHVAAVAKNLEESLKRHHEILGVEPWIIHYFVPPFHRETYVRERPANYTLKVAIAKMGDIYYELIEPQEGPSIHKEFLETKGEGLHHVGRRYNSLEEVKKDLEAFKTKGIKILQQGMFHGSHYFYLDTEPLIGVIYEIVYVPLEIKPARIYP
ncbi:MAG: VOC family protein [Candidatus Bathyarchaeia archaeon]